MVKLFDYNIYYVHIKKQKRFQGFFRDKNTSRRFILLVPRIYTLLYTYTSRVWYFLQNRL